MFLDCSPLEFMICSESKHIAYVQLLTQVTPKIEVLFKVVDHEIHVKRLSFVNAKPHMPKPFSLSLSTRCKPSGFVEQSSGQSSATVNNLRPSTV